MQWNYFFQEISELLITKEITYYNQIFFKMIYYYYNETIFNKFLNFSLTYLTSIIFIIDDSLNIFISKYFLCSPSIIIFSILFDYQLYRKRFFLFFLIFNFSYFIWFSIVLFDLSLSFFFKKKCYRLNSIKKLFFKIILYFSKNICQTGDYIILFI